jgi:hypothetical protein
MAREAGWYPDPYGEHEHRYHDGTGWTEHVADRGVAGTDPLPETSWDSTAPVQTSPTATQPITPPPSSEWERRAAQIDQRPWYRRPLFIVLAAIAAVLLLAGIVGATTGSQESNTTAPELTTIAPSSTTITEAPTTTTTTLPPTTTTTLPATTTTTAQPTSAQPSDCTPGYDPCIPPGPDVDCAGGSGNGPRYVRGPVRVTGPDIYDLDRDGNGIGCQ